MDTDQLKFGFTPFSPSVLIKFLQGTPTEYLPYRCIQSAKLPSLFPFHFFPPHFPIPLFTFSLSFLQSLVTPIPMQNIGAYGHHIPPGIHPDNCKVCPHVGASLRKMLLLTVWSGKTCAQTQKPEDHLLSTVHDCLFLTFSAYLSPTHRIWRPYIPRDAPYSGDKTPT